MLQGHPLANFLGKIWGDLGKIWQIWLKFGQNQNLATPKTFDRLYSYASSYSIQRFWQVYTVQLWVLARIKTISPNMS